MATLKVKNNSATDLVVSGSVVVAAGATGQLDEATLLSPELQVAILAGQVQFKDTAPLTDEKAELGRRVFQVWYLRLTKTALDTSVRTANAMAELARHRDLYNGAHATAVAYLERSRDLAQPVGWLLDGAALFLTDAPEAKALADASAALEALDVAWLGGFGDLTEIDSAKIAAHAAARTDGEQAVTGALSAREAFQALLDRRYDPVTAKLTAAKAEMDDAASDLTVIAGPLSWSPRS